MADAEASLAGLLDAMHAALRRGDLAALAALTPALETRLAADGVPRDAVLLSALRRKLERNRACLEAAGRGLRAARRRLAEIAGAAGGLLTYGAQGQITRIAAADSRLARRL